MRQAWWALGAVLGATFLAPAGCRLRRVEKKDTPAIGASAHWRTTARKPTTRLLHRRLEPVASVICSAPLAPRVHALDWDPAADATVTAERLAAYLLPVVEEGEGVTHVAILVAPGTFRQHRTDRGPEAAAPAGAASAAALLDPAVPPSLASARILAPVASAASSLASALPAAPSAAGSAVAAPPTAPSPGPAPSALAAAGGAGPGPTTSGSGAPPEAPPRGAAGAAGAPADVAYPASTIVEGCAAVGRNGARHHFAVVVVRGPARLPGLSGAALAVTPRAAAVALPESGLGIDDMVRQQSAARLAFSPRSETSEQLLVDQPGLTAALAIGSEVDFATRGGAYLVQDQLKILAPPAAPSTSASAAPAPDGPDH